MVQDEHILIKYHFFLYSNRHNSVFEWECCFCFSHPTSMSKGNIFYQNPVQDNLVQYCAYWAFHTILHWLNVNIHFSMPSFIQEMYKSQYYYESGTISLGEI